MGNCEERERKGKEMTNKEAIELLKPLTKFSNNGEFISYPMVTDEKTVEAVKMAIKALIDKDVMDATLQDMSGNKYE